MEKTIKYMLAYQQPEGKLMEDQISCIAFCELIGGQLITGKQQFPEHTGPNPLLRPATAIITVGTREAGSKCSVYI